MNPIILYTDAPKDYDYYYVEELVLNHSYFGHKSDPNPKVLRKIQINSNDPAYHAGYQSGRYQSGMHVVFTEDDYQDEVKSGYIRPCENPQPFFRQQFILDIDDIDDELYEYIRTEEGSSLVKVDTKFIDRKMIVRFESINEEQFNNRVKDFQHKIGQDS